MAKETIHLMNAIVDAAVACRRAVRNDDNGDASLEEYEAAEAEFKDASNALLDLMRERMAALEKQGAPEGEA